jgi:hypothetical protein
MIHSHNKRPRIIHTRLILIKLIVSGCTKALDRAVSLRYTSANYQAGIGRPPNFYIRLRESHTR